MSRFASKTVLLGLDIGTHFAKAVIGQKTDGEPLEIFGSGCVKQQPGAMEAGVIMDIPSVADSCERAIHEAETTSGLSASSVVVGIAGELVKCNTSTVRYRRKNSNRPLSDSEMSVILEKVQTAAQEKARDEIAFETDNPRAEAALVNSAIVSIFIDGQKVNNPIGFKGSDIVIEFYTAFAPSIHVRAIEKVCADLNLDLIAIAVDPFAICRACLGDSENADTPAILIDVGGSNTSIAIVDENGIRGTETFSIGAHSIERDISVWLSGVEIALKDFPHIKDLPCRIFLCGGGANLSELQEELALGNWYQNLNFSRRPVVNLIEISDLPDIKNSIQTELESTFVTAIGLVRIAVDTLDANSKPKLRLKISKILHN